MLGSTKRAPSDRRRFRATWLPFGLCLLLSVAATLIVRREEHQIERDRFASDAHDASDRIQERMASYLTLLRASAGYLSRDEPVSPNDFRHFVDRLRLTQNYPGTLGIGFSARFDGGVAAAAARVRELGWTDVERIWPDMPRDEVHAIVMLEPLDPVNRPVLGFDMHTEEKRRATMDTARDMGRVAMTGRVTLLQEGLEPHQQHGFLIYTPVFVGGTIPISVAERRAALKGFAYMPLRADDLFAGIFGGARPSVGFELYDGEGSSDDTRLGRFGKAIAPDDDVLVEKMAVADRVWTVRFVHDPVATRETPIPLALVVALLGALLSIAVLVESYLRERSREREIEARAAAMASEELSRFLQTFLGILGHDLRTPLSAISISSQSLLRRSADDSDTRDTLKRIVGSTRRMSRMIDEALDLTRTRVGLEIPIDVKPVDLGALVRDVVDEVSRSRDGAVIDVTETGDLDGVWDAGRLAQVVSNLVGNAVQYRHGDPVRVAVDGTSPASVNLTVHNAGAIPPAALPTIFEPFRGSGDAPEGMSRGLGLGLYIARALVNAHGGTIDVTSVADAGTTFTITLPRQPKRSIPPHELVVH